jgi:hypothetical protein
VQRRRQLLAGIPQRHGECDGQSAAGALAADDILNRIFSTFCIGK